MLHHTQHTAQVTPAIPAAKNLLGDEAIYYLLGRPALWNFFSRIWVQTIGPLPRPSDGPLIFYLNHASWWDGYMMMLTHRAILHRRFESYLMMEEKQLRAYRFFTWCGAFSINRHNPADVEATMTYISRLLRERRDRALYIFPQGRIVHNDLRPIVTYPGVANIAERVGDVALCPVIYRYEFRGEQRPEAFIRMGPFHRAQAPYNAQALQSEITQRLTASADALRDAVIAGDTSNFAVLMHGRPGIDRLFDSWRRLIRNS